MINLQWGTQKNGQIDTHLLVDVSGRGDYLEPTAAALWKRMVAACKAATGVTLAPAPGSSAYRPLSIQQDFYAKRQAYLAGKGPYFPVAAVPGTSNHGWGRAIDLTGYEGNAKVWAWLQGHAGEFGYDWATGRASGEDWHWECLTPPGTSIASDGNHTTIPTKEEADMAKRINLRVISAPGAKPDGTLYWYSEKRGIVPIQNTSDASLLSRMEKVLNDGATDTILKVEYDRFVNIYL